MAFKILEQLEGLISRYVELKADIKVTKEISKGLEGDIRDLYEKFSIIVQRVTSVEAKIEGVEERIWLKLENKYLRQKETRKLELENNTE